MAKIEIKIPRIALPQSDLTFKKKGKKVVCYESSDYDDMLLDKSKIKKHKKK